MLVALDTNVLCYAEALDDAARAAAAVSLLAALDPSDIVVPVQVLGELARVLRRKGQRGPDSVTRALEHWAAIGTVHPTNEETLWLANGISATHGLDIWDAIIVAAAQQAGCGLLLSEDLQDGFVWRGLTVANPFAEHRHPLLTSILGS